MPKLETSPSETAAQVSALLPSGEPMLAILAKRTYVVDALGRCVAAPEQAGFVGAPVPDPEVKGLLLADSDLVAYKLRTDVVVHGHVYGDGRARRLEAGVKVAGLHKRLLALGERRCSLSRAGAVLFSDPAPIDKVPLRWTHAYGGRDRGGEAKYGNPLKEDPKLAREMPDVDLDAASPFLYPRNPCGRGYLVEVAPAAVEALELPQLEDPSDPLSPARLAAGEVDQWYRMPLPQGTGWVDYGWYPRCAFVGIVPCCEWFDAPPAEVERGLVPRELADGTGQVPPLNYLELASGAALGLQAPHLRGGETVELLHMHPQHPRWRVVVPAAPRLAVDARKGKLRTVEPVLHTLVVEPDEGRVTVVWRGCAPALRTYLPAELAEMPMRAAWDD